MTRVVVHAPDPLDEVDDGRHPRLVAFGDEPRDDEDDPQPRHVSSARPPPRSGASAERYATTHNPSTIHAHVRPAVGAQV